jgi:hypothetical protein
MQDADSGSPVLKDAVRAFSIVGRIINYFFIAMFTVGLSVIGIASFMSGTGSTTHRVFAALGYVAFFGVGFGLLFLSQYVLRIVLAIFFNAGVSALQQEPGAPNAGDPGNDPNRSSQRGNTTGQQNP